MNISFDKELKVGMGYDLLCSGLMDLEGNKIPESSTEIRLEYEEEPDAPEEPEVPDTPSFPAGSIRINEVMADPKGQKAFPETEYVELYNTTDKAIELNGWSFLYGSKPTVLTALLWMRMDMSCFIGPVGIYILMMRGWICPWINSRRLWRTRGRSLCY